MPSDMLVYAMGFFMHGLCTSVFHGFLLFLLEWITTAWFLGHCCKMRFIISHNLGKKIQTVSDLFLKVLHTLSRYASGT